MKLEAVGPIDLTYCTNVHPGESWLDVDNALRTHVVELKQRLSWDAPFGVGLRLSELAARELLEGDRLSRLQDFLAEQGLYVFTLNGFPYGDFHGRSVKERVFAPDWRDGARVAYTLRLARVLGRLLPTGAGMDGLDGGISTVPLSYRSWIGADPDARASMARNLARVTAELLEMRDAGGPLLHVDLEPEPDGVLSDSVDLVRFFHRSLLVEGADWLADARGLSREEARQRLTEHIRVCFDTCHLAVGYEDPVLTLACLQEAGIRVGKLQVSSALRVDIPPSPKGRRELAWALEPFVESTWLHQVVELREDGRLQHYSDLEEALLRLDDTQAVQWRVHYHVPLFAKSFGGSASRSFSGLDSTRESARSALKLLQEVPYTRHVEIETYTWEVLPPELRLELIESIVREYLWVIEQLEAGARKSMDSHDSAEAEGSLGRGEAEGSLGRGEAEGSLGRGEGDGTVEQRSGTAAEALRRTGSRKGYAW